MADDISIKNVGSEFTANAQTAPAKNNIKIGNPFAAAQQFKEVKKNAVDVKVFNNDPKLPADNYNNKTAQNNKKAPVFGSKLSGYTTEMDFGKLSPLGADTFDNPIKKKEAADWRKALAGLIPKKTAIGDIPDKDTMELAIKTAYENSRSFRKMAQEIENLEVS